MKKDDLLKAMQNILTIKQVSEITGYSTAYLYKLVQRGRFRAHRPFGYSIVFFKEELMEDLMRVRQKGAGNGEA